jgi:hypothetical protein
MKPNVDTAEPVGSSYNACDLCSVGAQLECRSRYQVSPFGDFGLFLSVSRQILRYLKTCHYFYLPVHLISYNAIILASLSMLNKHYS